MLDLNFRKIRGFVAVAEEGSFRRASERINLSAPALSSQIHELEDILGVPLFHRTTRSVNLTREGQKFLVHAKRLIADVESVVLEIRDEAELLRGRVVIACVPTLASTILPQVIARFGERYPEIGLEVQDIVAKEVIELVRSREADFGFGPFLDAGQDFQFEALARDRFVAVVPAGHPVAEKTKVSLSELAKHPLIGLQAGNSVSSALRNAFASIGLNPTPLFDLQHHYTVGGMVQAGLGLTVLPSMAVPLLNAPDLRAVPIVKPVVEREIGIITRKGGGISPAGSAFLDMLTSSLDDIQKLIRPRVGARGRIKAKY